MKMNDRMENPTTIMDGDMENTGTNTMVEEQPPNNVSQMQWLANNSEWGMTSMNPTQP